MDIEKEYLNELSKSKQLAKYVVSLIRAHYEPDNPDGKDEFRDLTRDIARYFDFTGDGQISSYIRVLNGDDKNVWVPM